MIKVIITIKCKPGLTRAQFIDYYETKHAPLGRSVFGEFFLAYKRSYPIHDDPYAFAGAFDDAAAGKPEPGFDVMTEILVKDRDTMEKMLAAARLPENAPRFAADEENFMDRSSMRLYVTEEFS